MVVDERVRPYRVKTGRRALGRERRGSRDSEAMIIKNAEAELEVLYSIADYSRAATEYRPQYHL